MTLKKTDGEDKNMNTKFNLLKKLKEKVTNKAPEYVSENNFRKDEKNIY